MKRKSFGWLGKLLRSVKLNSTVLVLFLTAIMGSVQAASLDDGIEQNEFPLETISAEEIAVFEGVTGLISDDQMSIGRLDSPLSEAPFPSADNFLRQSDPTSGFVVPQAIPSLDLELPKPVQPKSPFVAVTLSSILPGLGHAYLGDMKTAGGLLGTVGAGVGSAAVFRSDPVISATSFATVSNTWMYGIYAAYRDVRIHNGQLGYSHPMPMDSLADLAYAPFNFRVIKKPEVWGGLLGSLVLAVGVTSLAFSKKLHARASHSLHRGFSPIVALPVGIGEESFFRGYLQSALSEYLTPWGGIMASSVLFGAAHIGNSAYMEPEYRAGYLKFVIPFITLSGIYDGWLTYKNHSLKSSVALHTWYDGVLFALSNLAAQSVVNRRVDFAVSLPF